MVWNKELREEHFINVAKFAWHGGPYIALFAAAVLVLLEFGFIDKPAFSADVQAIERNIGQLQSDVSEVQKKLDEALGQVQTKLDTQSRETGEIKTKLGAVEDKVGTIDEKNGDTLRNIQQQLNILINRGLNNGHMRQ